MNRLVTAIRNGSELRQRAAAWMSPSSWALLALVLAAVTWGTSFLLGKIALRTLPAQHLVFARFALAVLVLGPWAVRGLTRLDGPDVLRIAAAGIMMVPVSYLLQFEGLARTGASRAALIIGAAPAVIAIAATLFRGERPGRSTWIAAGVSTLGVAAIVGVPSQFNLTGDLLVFASLAGMAGWAVVTKDLLDRHPSMLVTVGSMLFGLVGLAAVMGVRGSGLGEMTASLAALDATGWAAVLGLGLGCTALTYVLWTAGLRRVDVSTSGVIINLEPLTGAVLGILLLGEPVTWGLALGGVCIIGATLLLKGT